MFSWRNKKNIDIFWLKLSPYQELLYTNLSRCIRDIFVCIVSYELHVFLYLLLLSFNRYSHLNSSTGTLNLSDAVRSQSRTFLELEGQHESD